MTEELQELGLNVGHRRVGRLMRENGIKIITAFCVLSETPYRFAVEAAIAAQWRSAAKTIQIKRKAL